MSIGLTELQRMTSLPRAFFAAADRYPDRPAQWCRSASGYTPTTYRELAGRIRRVASALIRAGVRPGQRIALLMENRPEWAVADYAVMSVGAVTVPLYCSFREQDMVYVFQDSGASMAIGSGGKLARTLLEAVAVCPEVKSVYIMQPSDGDERSKPFSELEDSEVDAEALEARLQALSRQTLATLSYTSGTTGNLKGVMLSHGNFLSSLEAVPEIIRFREDDAMLSVLPLAHSLERFASHFMPYSFGLSVAFAERPDTVARNLNESRPTFMVVVPRLLEVMRDRVQSHMAQQPTLVRCMFRTYIALADRVRGGEASLPERMRWHLLDRIVGKRIRRRFGGRLRLMVSGGAPLAPDVAAFFEAVGLPVLEGYGLTESAALISVNPVNDRRVGTVGKAVRGVAVRIAGDGEIAVRGGNIMQGYWGQSEAADAAIVGGWFHTGDVGEMDADGYLRITDRKKDMIVNSGGKNIAPQRIERLLSADAMIEQAVVYGDRKPYLVALLVPSKEGCLHWAREEALPEMGWPELVGSETLRRMLQRRTHDALKALPQYEQIRRIAVHAEPFSIDDGLLTPTLKVRRNRVYERFKEVFEGLY